MLFDTLKHDFNWFRDTANNDAKNWSHFCPNSRDGLEVRRYHSLYCSLCMVENNTNFLATKDQVDLIERALEGLKYVE
jgi:hypothetical protein